METSDVLGDNLLCLWAKLPRDKMIHSYHPLICHFLDVSMVTQAIWTEVLPRRMRQRVSADFGFDEEVTGRWVTFLSGAHDIGKASVAFAVRQETPSALTERMKVAGLFVPEY